MRKRSSERYLHQRGIATNPHLPAIESAEEIHPASAQQAMGRLCVLSGLASLAHGCPLARVLAWFEAEHLFDQTTAVETDLLRRGELSPSDQATCRSQVEAVWLLAWALHLAPTIDHLSPCPADLVTRVPKPADSTAQQLRGARLRSAAELLDQADILYRLHWAVRDAQLQGKPLPSGMPGYVTEQRLRAANWVLLSSVAWEAVDTST